MSDDNPRTALEHFNASAEGYEAGTGGCTRQVAEHIIALIQNLKPITPESKILDNACGTGIVTDQLLRSYDRITQVQPEIHAVDGAENMIRIAKARFPSYEKFHAAVMPAEQLSFPDDTFSHSITNLGLMFLDDADKGAREIVRTLQPSGVAVVTGWEDLGYVEIIQGVQKRIRPAGQLFEVPLPRKWFDPEYTKTTSAQAGLGELEASEILVHFGAETAEDVAALLMRSLGQAAFGTWSDDERKKAGKMMKDAVEKEVVPFNRGDGSGVGIVMKATVFVGCKAVV